MSDQDIFEDNKQQETPAQQTNPEQTDLFSDQLSQIKGEDGRQKYDDVNKALEALKHSQEYIPELKQKVEQLELELDKRKSVEDVVAKLTGNQVTEETTEVSGLNAEAVEELVAKQLNQREVQTAEAGNMALVLQELTNKFGEKAKETVAAKATELGTTTKNLQEMARKQPKVFLALFGSSPSNVSNPTTSSTVPQIGESKGYEAPTPKKSVLAGASAADQVAHWRDIQKEVYEKHNIEN